MQKFNELTQDLEVELRVYDRKVYRQTHQMIEDFNRRLNQMRIPFFGTRRVALPNDKPKRGEISAEDLKALQRRMLQHLEDLCGDGDH